MHITNKIIFFVPEQGHIIGLLKQGHLLSYLPVIRSVENVVALKELIDPKDTQQREQLVFIGTARRTGMEPEELAKLIKSWNERAHVVLTSVSMQEYAPPVDGFVLLSSGAEMRALVNIVMSRA